ncbi:MAG: AbrB/MazE/SpoVT family DNA-binding domain-containing protein, partial [Zestosphaera sp.]
FIIKYLDKRSIVGVVVFMPIIARTRVGRYYRTTIPREVRKLLELRENDEVEWVFENGVLLLSYSTLPGRCELLVDNSC